MTLFYALFSWRSYAERDRYIELLRPFVASHGLYEDISQPSAAEEVDLQTPFHALCKDVLGVKVAYLAAMGPLAPLVGSPIAFPEGVDVPPMPLEGIGMAEGPRSMFVQVDSRKFGGALWAVPLWSERGLIGVLLLGEKRDGGLYTQEEIEIAREVGERLIDTQASAELAQRLMLLQRQRMAESQVIDNRTRRVLHDDVLPRLHAAMLGLGPEASPQAITTLADAHKLISNLLREMPSAGMPEVKRMGVVGALQRAVDEEFSGAFDEVTWDVGPDVTKKVQAVPPVSAEVVFYAAREAIRNAARHGRNGDATRPLRLNVRAAWRNGLEMLVEDDGVGVGAGAGAGSHSHGGSGQGLALHTTLMAVVGGSLAVESAPGRGTKIHLTLPQGN
jgi:signal transduction histidine kinase